MEPVAAAASAAGAARHGNITQTMPATARTEPVPVVRSTKPDSKVVKATPASKPVKPQTEKEGYTFGDVLRSFPSTVWTFMGGMAVLLLFAVAIAVAGFMLQGGNESELNGSFIAAGGIATPTLPSDIPNQTPTLVPTPTSPPESLSLEPAALTAFSSEDLDITLEYPEDWENEEDDQMVIFSPSQEGLAPDDLADSAFWVSLSDEEDVEISDLLVDILDRFPGDAETLNEGTISIASQTWTSAQIRFESEALGGQGIATLAVTNRDGVGYTLVAVAPAPLWNTLQPVYQEMINSFRFGAEALPVAESKTTPAADNEESDLEADEADTTPMADDEADDESGTPSAKKTPSPTPTPEVTATPVTYIISSGDTLLAIANQFGVDVDLLAEENGIADPSGLQLGQELIIPFTAEELAAYNGDRPPASPATTDDEEEESTTTTGEDEETGGSSPGSTPAPAAPADEEENETAASIGGRIVYPAFNPGINSYDLWMVDVNSTDQTIIAGDASQPAFNRDGSLLAYRSWVLDSRGIFFRDFVGGRGGQVTRFVEDGLPTWSPDGYSFAFASRREGDRVPRLFSGNQTGKGDTGIGFNGEYPSTFPDGRIVSKGCSVSGDCGLYVMGAGGGGATKISSDTGDTAPAVSPDGSKIAIMSAGRGGTNWEIWVLNADGSNPKRLTENGSNEGLPAWSPDGKSIAYVSDQGGLWAIWVMNADGTNQRKLVNMSGSPDGKVLHAGSDSKGWLEERITWAP
jgi:LysM repeat protein